MSQPQVSDREISAMAEDYYSALAVGDRARAGGIFKKLIERIGKIDPDNLKGALELFRKLLDSGVLPNAEPVSAQSEAAINALAHDDLQAAGITDNVALWVEFLTLLFEFIRRIRSGGATPAMVGVGEGVTPKGAAELERHYPQGNPPGMPTKEGGSPESSPQLHPPKPTAENQERGVG